MNKGICHPPSFCRWSHSRSQSCPAGITVTLAMTWGPRGHQKPKRTGGSKDGWGSDTVEGTLPMAEGLEVGDL